MTEQKDWMKVYTAAADYIREHVGTADIGIVLGSGLGSYAETLENGKFCGYKDIPGFPVSTAPGHAGRWWNGMLAGKRVCMMQGRFHTYEGYDMKEVTMGVRVMALLGVKTLIVTNAAGGVNLTFKPGDMMALTDVINYSGVNPLIGSNLDAFGPRFPDMGQVCDPRLLAACEEEAGKLGIGLRKGVYMWFSGPSYETPAEIRMARVLGADAVGMSTVPEMIAARHSGMSVLGISCITNMAAGILDQKLDEQEVIEAANRVQGSFRALLGALIARA